MKKDVIDSETEAMLRDGGIPNAKRLRDALLADMELRDREANAAQTPAYETIETRITTQRVRFPVIWCVGLASAAAILIAVIGIAFMPRAHTILAAGDIVVNGKAHRPGVPIIGSWSAAVARSAVFSYDSMALIHAAADTAMHIAPSAGTRKLRITVTRGMVSAYVRPGTECIILTKGQYPLTMHIHGTTFSVDVREARAVTVAVAEGGMLVQPSDASMPGIRIRPGEQYRFAGGGHTASAISRTLSSTMAFLSYSRGDIDRHEAPIFVPKEASLIDNAGSRVDGPVWVRGMRRSLYAVTGSTLPKRLDSVSDTTLLTAVRAPVRVRGLTNAIRFAPSVSGDDAVVCDEHRLSLIKNGTLRWSTDIPRAVIYAPLITRSSVIVLMRGEAITLHVYDRLTGRSTASIPTRLTRPFPAAAFENTVIIADASGEYLSYDIARRSAVPGRIPEEIVTAPTADSTGAIVCGRTGIYAVGIKTIRIATAPGSIIMPAVSYRGNIALGLADGSAAIIDRTNGTCIRRLMPYRMERIVLVGDEPYAVSGGWIASMVSGVVTRLPGTYIGIEDGIVLVRDQSSLLWYSLAARAIIARVSPGLSMDHISKTQNGALIGSMHEVYVLK